MATSRTALLSEAAPDDVARVGVLDLFPLPHDLRTDEGCGVILLVSGATAYPRNADVGHLIVPKQWNDPAKLDLRSGGWAMESGGFNGFDAGAFVRMLEAYHPYHAYHPCRFVVAPDVVADAASTRKLWPFWSRLILGLGYPVAFVAQDGLRPDQVPWTEMSTLFVGGSTKYKESAEARTLCGIAKARGLWVHWGRVNGKRRYELAKIAGADSLDGTGFSMASNVNIPKVGQWDAELAQQSTLDIRPAASVGAADDRPDGIVA